jgi:SAM-dependent methyltransferase
MKRRPLPIRPARSTDLELLDRPGNEPAQLSGNLADLRRVNRWLGGVRLTLDGLERLTVDLRPGEVLRILDVATGAADIPVAMTNWATRRGLQAWILATDRSAEILRHAENSRTASVQFAVADARQLPFADDSFDVVTCSLVLHHLNPDEAVSMLREMSRVARRGIVVNDLVRNWPGYTGAWLLSRTLTRNRLTRHDAPLSTRRAYTRREMQMLLARAELCPLATVGFLGYRVAMIAQAAP